MMMNILRSTATSIAFVLGAVAITTSLWALAAFGYEIIPGQQVDSWFMQGTATVLYALLTGFLVDAMRLTNDLAARLVASRRSRRSRNRYRAGACLAS